MKKINKKNKILITLGSLATVIAPIASTVSMSFNEAKASTPLFLDNEHSFYINKTFSPNLGLASAARTFERRRDRSSDELPTGFYALADKPVTVYLKDAPQSEGVSVNVSLYGDYEGITTERLDVSESFAIPALTKSITFTPKHQGLIYLQNSTAQPITVAAIAGEAVEEVPTYTKDSGAAALRSFMQSAAVTTSPFVEIVGERVFATFSTRTFRDILAGSTDNMSDLNERIESWDLAFNRTDDFYGVNRNYTGVANRSPHMIHIVTGDTNPGSWTARSGRVYLYRNGSYGLLRDSAIENQWLLWHEMNHLFQASDWYWDGLLEVTVNIAPLRMLYLNNLPMRDQNDKAVKAFMALPIEQRHFDTATRHAQVMMMYQLEMAFGLSFYPNLSEAYRMQLQNERPANSAAEKQMYMVMTSKTAGVNLLPFFKQWGMSIDAATEKEINDLNLPELVKPIWLNGVEPERIVEKELPPYVITSSKNLAPINNWKLGESIDVTNISKRIQSDMIVTKVIPNYINIQKQTSGMWTFTSEVYVKGMWKDFDNAVAESGEFAPNRYTIPTSIYPSEMTNSFKLLGISNTLRGYVSIDSGSKKINFVGNDVTFHNSWTGSLYAQIQLFDQTGQVVKNIDVSGQDNFNNVIRNNDLLNGLSYQKGYQLKIHYAEASRLQKFDPLTNDFKAQTSKDTIIDL